MQLRGDRKRTVVERNRAVYRRFRCRPINDRWMFGFSLFSFLGGIGSVNDLSARHTRTRPCSPFYANGRHEAANKNNRIDFPSGVSSFEFRLALSAVVRVRSACGFVASFRFFFSSTRGYRTVRSLNDGRESKRAASNNGNGRRRRRRNSRRAETRVRSEVNAESSTRRWMGKILATSQGRNGP